MCPAEDTVDELIEVIPWIPVRESALTAYGLENAQIAVTGVGFIGTDAGVISGEAVSMSFDEPSGPVTYSMGRIATDVVVDALTDENSPEAVSAVLAGRIAAIRSVIGQALIAGDGTADYGNISGLATVCHPTGGYYVAGAASAANVADLVYHQFHKQGLPDLLVTSPTGMVTLDGLLPRGSDPVYVPALGYRVPSWNGIPILRTEHIPFVSGATDVYALRLGPPCGVRFIYPARLGRNLITVRRIDSWDNDVVKYRVSATLGFVAPVGGAVARYGGWN